MCKYMSVGMVIHECWYKYMSVDMVIHQCRYKYMSVGMVIGMVVQYRYIGASGGAGWCMYSVCWSVDILAY